MKKVLILGSTGSIGINTLKVIERFPDQFKVIGLSAYSNLRLLEKQIKRFSPSYVAVNSAGVDYFKKYVNLNGTKILDVDREIQAMAAFSDVDIVLLGIRGSAALLPFLSAVRAGKIVAPANKEALVMAGHIIMSEAKKHGAQIIPVDSEQSAIFQCLQGRKKEELKKVYLTASGGPLRDVPRARFDKISVKEILKHPRWKMGKKITVDSATLMNKGLEVIEARWLFDVDVKNIEILVHPEAIIHSMVEFRDGSVIAQLGITDMRLPIQYALTYPNRLESNLKDIDFCEIGTLTFKKPDFNKFPMLRLCIEVAKRAETFPCVLNAANEEAVEAFLKGKLKFSKIYTVVEKVVQKHHPSRNPDLDDIWKADHWAREEARSIILN